jgi:hypothetical protein
MTQQRPLKSVKAWAIWNEADNEPWGVIVYGMPREDSLTSFGLFNSKSDAYLYRRAAFMNRTTRSRQAVIQVSITPLKPSKKKKT